MKTETAAPPVARFDWTDPLALDARWLEYQLRGFAESIDDVEEDTGGLVEVPVRYGGEYGPDLADVARFGGISEEEVIALHTSRTIQAAQPCGCSLVATDTDMRLSWARYILSIGQRSPERLRRGPRPPLESLPPQAGAPCRSRSLRCLRAPALSLCHSQIRDPVYLRSAKLGCIIRALLTVIGRRSNFVLRRVCRQVTNRFLVPEPPIHIVDVVHYGSRPAFAHAVE